MGICGSTQTVSSEPAPVTRVKERTAPAPASLQVTDRTTPVPVPAQQVADRTIPHPAPLQTARSLSRTASTSSKRERMHRNEIPSQDSKARSRARSEPQQPPQSLKSSSSQNPRTRAETLVAPKGSNRRDSRPPMPGESTVNSNLWILNFRLNFLSALKIWDLHTKHELPWQ